MGEVWIFSYTMSGQIFVEAVNVISSIPHPFHFFIYFLQSDKGIFDRTFLTYSSLDSGSFLNDLASFPLCVILSIS